MNVSRGWCAARNNVSQEQTAGTPGGLTGVSAGRDGHAQRSRFITPPNTKTDLVFLNTLRRQI